MSAVLQSDPVIRAMTRDDLDVVSRIDAASYPFPWTRGIFQDCLRIGYRCHVLTVDHSLAGYSVVSQALDEAHLLNLCIHPENRRQGLARLMLDEVVHAAQINGADRLFLEVRPSNRAAINLYRRSDFRVIGRRPGYYPAEQGREDAMVMVLHLG